MQADERVVGSDATVQEIAAAFGIRGVTRWADLGGSSTTNLLIACGSRRYVARIHRARTSAARLAAEQAARIALSEAGLPTAAPAHTVDGVTFTSLASGRLAEVERYVGWEHRMVTEPLLRIGHWLLAQVHDVLRTAQLPAAADRVPDANYLPSETAAEQTREGAKLIRSWRDSGLSEFADAVVEHIDAVTVAEAALRGAQLVQVTHGDFWDNNVLFVGDRPVLLLDFGFMARRPRIEDLALTAYFYLLEPGRGPPGEPERAAIRSFLDAYDSSAALPLSEAERAALPLVIARQPAWSVGGWVRKLPRPHAVSHAYAAAQEFPVAQAVRADLPLWQAALAKV